jgi:hypothetical protein
MLAGVIPEAAGAAGMEAFNVDVLHPARTLIEKLFAVLQLGVYLAGDQSIEIKGGTRATSTTSTNCWPRRARRAGCSMTVTPPSPSSKTARP